MPDAHVTLLPESKRNLNTMVIGLNAEDDKYYLLPPLKNSGKGTEERKTLEKEFYELDIELSHGGIMRVLPKNSRIYMAIPDRKQFPGSLGGERGYFEDYLAAHCGWDKKRIAEQIRFFHSPVPLTWAQDFCVLLGYDDKGRDIIGLGSQGDIEGYRQAAQQMVKSLPKQFALREFEKGVSAEGGDQLMVLMPDGKPGYLIGRHRVREFVKRWGENVRDTEPLTKEQVERARAAFSRSVFGLPVVIVPEAPLYDPSLGDPDLFHLDMSVTAAYVGGQAVAFVPQYQDTQADRNSESPISPSKVASLEREYDLIAKEMAGHGFEVARVPIADHPVRSPVNVCKYYDSQKGHKVALLNAYPRHLPLTDPNTPQRQVQQALQKIRENTLLWQQAQSETAYRQLLEALRQTWQVLQEAGEGYHPVFEKQKAIYEKYGFEVVPVPAFVWGAGGLHCQTLH